MAAAAITRHEVAGGIKIYRMPIQVFPSLVANVYLVLAGDYSALIDTGSGLGESDGHLRAALERVRDDWGENLEWSDLRRIIISHAHIDHHGGLNLVRSLTDAPIAVHELDWRVLVHYEERRALTRFRVGIYLQRAGLSGERHARMLQMYTGGKGSFSSVDVSDVLRDGDLLDGIFRVHHAPGHCPGQVCLQIDDVLLTADHVLPHTAIFLAPESLNASTGVDHYLQALKKIAAIPGIRLALGGHEEPMPDMYATIQRIERQQQQRIERTLAACNEPYTIAELTASTYPGLGGYDELLALQKIGAYLEYLDQRGMLEIANLDEVVQSNEVAPKYRAIKG
jgi:glyoxylase-like metal-dependent hydrolase (beta-lactamase superfamily II)